MFGANLANPVAPSRIKVGLRWAPRWRRKRERRVTREGCSFDGKERSGERKGRERAYRRTERALGEGTRMQGVGCVVTLLGDEANMHALDPAKVHLDRIALHYAVLQRCSVSYGATNRRWRVEQVREEETKEPLVTSCVPCHHPVSHSSTV